MPNSIVGVEIPLQTKTEKEVSRVLQLKVAKQTGGMNYATYKNEEKGYALHVTPLGRTKPSDDTGYYFEVWTGFSGLRFFLEGTNRFSDKKLTELAQKVRDTYQTDEIYQSMIKQVLEQNNETLLEEDSS